MIFLDFLLVILGLTIFTFKDFFVGIIERLNRRSNTIIDRDIIRMRLTVGSLFAAGIGIIGFLRNAF